jgi:hypothetical protein
MHAGTGRNDPCPCGSGRKYKHCCLPRDEAIAPEELTWRRVRGAIDRLADRILGEALQHFGRVAVDEAWAEFTLWRDEEGVDPESPDLQLFMPWFLYGWLPDPDETEVPEAARDTTAARAYAQRMGRRLDPLTARYIDACGRAAFSFHEVLAAEPGRGLRLRDLMLGTEVFAFEESGSRDARAGDLMFARVVPIDGIAVIDGCGPAVLPPIDKPRVIELRKSLQGLPDFSPALLREAELDLLDLYHELAERVLNPRLPALQNTDGEPLAPQRLLWDIDDAGATFTALADLAAGETAAELRAAAEHDAAGNLVRVEIPWRKPGNAVHSTWTNTLLGALRIEGRELRAEVNSAERAARLRALVDERLGDRARFRVAKVESVQAMMERVAANETEAERREREAERARLMESPEVRAALAGHLRGFYRDWLDQRIPALGNRTPREAIADADGREAVAALVLQIERDGERLQPPLDPAIVRELREALGLAGSS